MNIFMTLMGLEIGGAETHVVELIGELIRRGHQVTVASNGGVYVEELTALGVTHHTVPLHSKRLSNMLKSYGRLKEIIQNNSFDLVHAHARIPAFLCGLLQRRLRFRFITTTHWVFKTSPLLNLMTNWGERTVAVSEDIKTYLMDNYHLPPEQITVTINGVDTHKFSPETGTGGVELEFRLAMDKRRIVYVSRMDADRSAVAFHLLEIAPHLHAKFGDVEIVIVGGGNDFARLQQRAEQTNREIGHQMVIVTGARTDINHFIATAHCFVGVSRAVLEAMSAAKPVIIGGNEGYIGIYQPDNHDIAVATNFCCRGCQPATPQLLYNDLAALLGTTEDQLVAVGQYNRQTILEHYSVEKMTNDYELAYEKLLATNPLRPKDVLISGYYGYKNVGDDSLLESIVSSLKANKPDISITVLSARPRETSAIYGIKSMHRFNLFGIWFAMGKTKLLISGGGSLIQDDTSTKSLDYYLTIIRLAKKRGMRVMLYANGIGPVSLEKNRRKCKRALNQVDLITLRDEESAQELEQMGVTKPPIALSADPAFALEKADDARVAHIMEQEKLDPAARYFVVSLREWKHSGLTFERSVAALCEHVSERFGLTPLFISMQGSVDRPICRRVRGMLQCKSELLRQNYGARDLLGLLHHCEFVIGMRLHLLIYALSVGIPVLGLSYNPKVDALLHQFQQNPCGDVKDVQLSHLIDGIDSLMADQQHIRGEISTIAAQMRDKTKDDAKSAIKLLLF